MENVVNFLLDYYIWILVVLGIIIITIIGFLVDSKNKSKKRIKNEELTEVKTVEPLPETKMDDTPITQNVLEQNVLEQNVVTNDQNNDANVLSSPSIMEESVQNVQETNVSDDMPKINLNESGILSQQTPHFEPREVQMPQNVSSNNVIPGPRPINAVPINQPVQPRPVMPQNNQMQQPVNSMQNVQMIRPTQMGYNNAGQVVNQQPQMSVNPQMMNMNPVSNMQSNSVNSMPINNQQLVQQPISQSQPVEVEPLKAAPAPSNFGINFVTNENNAPSENNDDTWKL